MDVKLVFRNKKLQFLLSVLLLGCVSFNAYSASPSLARPATHADIGSLTGPTVETSNPSVATATITSLPVIPGVHNLQVNQLAQAQQFASRVYENQAASLGITETLTIIADMSLIKVDVSASDSLNQIAKKINNAASSAHLNAIASVAAMQSAQYRLVIGSTLTGIANAVKIQESGIPGGMLDISQSMTIAQDAKFVFDGLAYSTSSNSNIMGEWLLIRLNGVGNATLTVHDM